MYIYIYDLSLKKIVPNTDRHKIIHILYTYVATCSTYY